MKRMLFVFCLLFSAFNTTTVKADAWSDIRFVYNSRFGREPDGGGWAGWVYNYTHGYSLATIIHLFAFSPEGAAVVNGIYVTRLERNADPGGQVAWMGYNEAYGIAAVASGIAHSGEAAIKVNGIYQACLGRNADPGGLAAWLNYLTGTSLNAVRVGVCNSPEAIRRRLTLQCSAQVASLYQLILRRAADAGGLSAYTGYCVNEDLAGRDGYAEVALSLATSEEARKDAAAAYLAVLERSPSSSELSAASQTMKGAGYKGLIAKLTTSSEAKTMIAQLFDATLERVPSSTELKTYLGKLGQDGVGMKGVRKLLQTSPEAQGLAKSPLYEAIASASLLDQATSCEKLVSCPAACDKLDASCFTACKEKHAECRVE